ncbi:DUF1963 domain-containing protein [Winogradskya consettensis]|uniref:DUF1963 domain-containing protein n=1 Tax=Winogradskya consettensis TaxID=113560 RepID=A0A919SHB1_9ACTN|nr:DUF1963 domain-containing protein [Actinoplanes consettensis]GIM71018.1 hypothetical protein Aco04nite_23320 [Actinoplanes consettensis]
MLNSRIEEFRASLAVHDITGQELDNWLEYARFYVVLPVVPEGPPPIDGPVAGRKGGLPLLPPDMPWPVGPSGPLPFHGLVDCAALPRSEHLDLQLPADGYFLFFVNFDDTMINFEDYEGTGDGFGREQEAARLIYVPGGTPVEERDGEAFPIVELRATISIDPPSWSSGEPSAEFAERVPNHEKLERLAGEFWRGWYGDRDIRLGGFTLTPQTEPTDVIAEHQQQVTGGDLDELRQQAEREWVPLAQLGSEEPVESATLARFMVKRAAVAAGDFSEVVSVAEFME